MKQLALQAVPLMPKYKTPNGVSLCLFFFLSLFFSFILRLRRTTRKKRDDDNRPTYQPTRKIIMSQTEPPVYRLSATERARLHNDRERRQEGRTERISPVELLLVKQQSKVSQSKTPSSRRSLTNSTLKRLKVVASPLSNIPSSSLSCSLFLSLSAEMACWLHACKEKGSFSHAICLSACKAVEKPPHPPSRTNNPLEMSGPPFLYFTATVCRGTEHIYCLGAMALDSVSKTLLIFDPMFSDFWNSSHLL